MGACRVVSHQDFFSINKVSRYGRIVEVRQIKHSEPELSTWSQVLIRRQSRVQLIIGQVVVNQGNLGGHKNLFMCVNLMGAHKSAKQKSSRYRRAKNGFKLQGKTNGRNNDSQKER